ncbi:uncharacterized protein CMU_008860 [Cryptosporidium muris RN66]|uniref:Uncharacterized protein n=1 Tax=Cryptosporidium muris (strain RN66) TaxID=441375 RepID=B6ADV3_CRYMR|nr:uncharacterized protein CMU_008860 [Cryptosporidium muris RN66]EEA06394.1 hypothetical protein, conserved [Cryptosporidium muris RN66]|eukprot:XP_002140743.1 hypothetical protein [Cryptosporidium muris RN66]
MYCYSCNSIINELVVSEYLNSPGTLYLTKYNEISESFIEKLQDNVLHVARSRYYEVDDIKSLYKYRNLLKNLIKDQMNIIGHKIAKYELVKEINKLKGILKDYIDIKEIRTKSITGASNSQIIRYFLLFLEQSQHREPSECVLKTVTILKRIYEKQNLILLNMLEFQKLVSEMKLVNLMIKTLNPNKYFKDYLLKNRMELFDTLNVALKLMDMLKGKFKEPVDLSIAKFTNSSLQEFVNGTIINIIPFEESKFLTHFGINLNDTSTNSQPLENIQTQMTMGDNATSNILNDTKVDYINNNTCKEGITDNILLTDPILDKFIFEQNILNKSDNIYSNSTEDVYKHKSDNLEEFQRFVDSHSNINETLDKEYIENINTTQNTNLNLRNLDDFEISGDMNKPALFPTLTNKDNKGFTESNISQTINFTDTQMLATPNKSTNLNIKPNSEIIKEHDYKSRREKTFTTRSSNNTKAQSEKAFMHVNSHINLKYEQNSSKCSQLVCKTIIRHLNIEELKMLDEKIFSAPSYIKYKNNYVTTEIWKIVENLSDNPGGTPRLLRQIETRIVEVSSAINRTSSKPVLSIGNTINETNNYYRGKLKYILLFLKALHKFLRAHNSQEIVDRRNLTVKYLKLISPLNIRDPLIKKKIFDPSKDYDQVETPKISTWPLREVVERSPKLHNKQVTYGRGHTNMEISTPPSLLESCTRCLMILSITNQVESFCDNSYIFANLICAKLLEKEIHNLTNTIDVKWLTGELIMYYVNSIIDRSNLPKILKVDHTISLKAVNYALSQPIYNIHQACTQSLMSQKGSYIYQYSISSDKIKPIYRVACAEYLGITTFAM